MKPLPPTLALIVALLFISSAWAQRLIHVTDPEGNGIEIATGSITKLRPHKGGCIIYQINSTQHVKETCATVLKLISE